MKKRMIIKEEKKREVWRWLTTILLKLIDHMKVDLQWAFIKIVQEVFYCKFLIATAIK